MICSSLILFRKTQKKETDKTNNKKAIEEHWQKIKTHQKHSNPKPTRQDQRQEKRTNKEKNNTPYQNHKTAE
jgi:hypothetical protein